MNCGLVRDTIGDPASGRRAVPDVAKGIVFSRVSAVVTCDVKRLEISMLQIQTVGVEGKYSAAQFALGTG